MFISNAFAAEGAAPAGGGDLNMIIVLTLCMVAVYFFVMRPNSKKRKEMQKLLDNLAVGDEVLTNGGIAGRISKLPENRDYVLITVCPDVDLQMKRNYVVAVLPKGTLEDSVKRSSAPAQSKAKPALKKKAAEDKKAESAPAEQAKETDAAAAAPAEAAPAEAPVADTAAAPAEADKSAAAK